MFLLVVFKNNKIPIQCQGQSGGFRLLRGRKSRGAGEQGSKDAGEQGSRGAGEQGSKGAREQGSKGAREQGSKGAGGLVPHPGRG